MGYAGGMEKNMETTIQGLGFRVWGPGCRPMINEAPPLKGLNIRIPLIIPIKGRG